MTIFTPSAWQKAGETLDQAATAMYADAHQVIIAETLSARTRSPIEAAAVAILQKKLPEIRKSHGITQDPGIVRASPEEARPQGISALIDMDSIENYSGRIIWL